MSDSCPAREDLRRVLASVAPYHGRLPGHVSRLLREMAKKYRDTQQAGPKAGPADPTWGAGDVLG